ncbi:TlpA disulfide reductase family protein [Mucilaginibacter xinganensis]|uniref:Thioredoxin domain-containing protein n=1 Tax=Mucilaginibacter xinganensis TaxID=1234841 RepID=A0A223NSV8_9SPHI|nr:TlpA disulfide reductase family protein [Mucilaginibacter xinganensis]ASU32972.1 hypothetical protein MuYL_1072 [Mucilaginibacter xinganensis]
MLLRTLVCFIIIALGNNPNCFSRQKESRFVLTGKVVGRDTGRLILSYISEGGKQVRDTAMLNNGYFSFTGALTEPTAATMEGNLQSPGHYNIYDPNFVVFFLECSKMTMVLKENDYAHAVITGSVTQQENEILQRQLAPALRVLVPLDNEYSKLARLYNSKKDTSAALQLRMDEIIRQVGPLKKEINGIQNNFLANHPDSYVSADILNSWIASESLKGDSAMMYYSMTTKRIRNSLQGQQALIKITSNLKARHAAEKGGIAGVGSQAPDFLLTGTHGKLVKLSSFKRKKYVLLDFWASWCGPCRENTPEIKELYKKYQQKGFEVIVISLDYDRSRWLKVMEKEKLTIWPHTYAGDLSTPKNFARETYGVLEIPQLILIDKEGKIIGRYAGVHDASSGAAVSDELMRCLPK